MGELKNSIGRNSDPDKEINVFENEDFELIPNYMEKQSYEHKKSIKKTKSADYTTITDSADYRGISVNAYENDPDYSSDDEEKKLRDVISDDELDITFDINEDEFDLLPIHPETIYSKADLDREVKAKDFTLKKLLRETSTGKVFLAQHNLDEKCYAMKSIK